MLDDVVDFSTDSTNLSSVGVEVLPSQVLIACLIDQLFVPVHALLEFLQLADSEIEVTGDSSPVLLLQIFEKIRDRRVIIWHGIVFAVVLVVVFGVIECSLGQFTRVVGSHLSSALESIIMIVFH